MGCGVEPIRAVLRAMLCTTPAGLLLVEETGQADRSPKLTDTWPKRCLSAPNTLKISNTDSFFLLAPRSSPR